VKLLLDEKISPGLAHHLSERFPGTQHVTNIDLRGSSDSEILAFARTGEYVVATKDREFAAPSPLVGSPKVVWLRLGNCTTADILDLLTTQASRLENFAESIEASLVVLPIGIET
jgi:predicted nuclease of predicted toxin-antitoxin system